MNDNIIAGLISGFLVTLLVVVFGAFWRSILVPWLEERVYKDAKIEGKWFSLYPATLEKRQETISLKRHGHNITGTIICSNGPDEGESYSLTGSFRNLILPLIYETDDKSKTDRGTITLMSVQNGKRFEGKLALYADIRDKIDDLDVIWFRSKDKLNEVLHQLENQQKEIKEFRKKKQESDEDFEKLTPRDEIELEINDNNITEEVTTEDDNS